MKRDTAIVALKTALRMMEGDACVKEAVLALLDEAREALWIAAKSQVTVEEFTEEPELLSISGFARKVGLDPKTVSRYVRQKMPATGKGRNCRIHVKAAKKWLNDGGPQRAAAARRSEIRRLGQEAHARSVQ